VGGVPCPVTLLYRKALYREYTDDSFTELKPRPPEQEYLGTLGPILRAEVGDTIKVVFKNNTAFPASMHPHGLFYEKGSEGSPYQDGTTGDKKGDDTVEPGEERTYLWEVPERAQDPTIRAPSCGCSTRTSTSRSTLTPG
jgi:manganese oxidase